MSNQIDIDNPAGGDCGFYAFSIGLIEIIQSEHEATGTSTTLNNWKDKANIDIDGNEILKFDLSGLQKNPRTYNKNFLYVLQMSLRDIAAESIKNDLPDIIRKHTNGVPDALAASDIHRYFAELVYMYAADNKIDRDTRNFNVLASSPDVLSLAENTARSMSGDDTAQRQHIDPVFFRDVYDVNNNRLKSDSVIIKGIDRIKEPGVWATQDDLKFAAEALTVNLTISDSHTGSTLENRPTVTLKNHGNNHWTTTVNEDHLKQEKSEPAVVSNSSGSSYASIEEKLQLTPAQKAFVEHNSKGHDNDGLKTELAKLAIARSSAEYQEKLKGTEGKNDSELSDEEAAIKLQEEEFKNPSMKP